MSIVVVERSFETERICGELAAREQATTACMQRQRVHALYALFARDHRRMVRVYDALDADAVRASQDDAELPYDRLWSARQLNVSPATPDPRYETVVVERELSYPLLPEAAEAFALAGRGCHERNRSSWIKSLLSLDGLRMLCVYSAPDAESVRNANGQLNAPFTRAWTATVSGTAPALHGGASSHGGE